MNKKILSFCFGAIALAIFSFGYILSTYTNLNSMEGNDSFKIFLIVSIAIVITLISIIIIYIYHSSSKFEPFLEYLLFINNNSENPIDFLEYTLISLKNQQQTNKFQTDIFKVFVPFSLFSLAFNAKETPLFSFLIIIIFLCFGIIMLFHNYLNFKITQYKIRLAEEMRFQLKTPNFKGLKINSYSTDFSSEKEKITANLNTFLTPRLYEVDTFNIVQKTKMKKAKKKKNNKY